MSVLSCSRLYCENIMCDICLPEVDYLCNSCIEEFKLTVRNSMLRNDEDIIEELKVFIKSVKLENRDNTDILESFFNKYKNQ